MIKEKERKTEATSMDLGFKDTGFQLVTEIQIPDVYYRRFKTGIDSVDELLGGEGFLPGSTLTIDAQAGTGKTTFLLQILNALALRGKIVGYASGEENKAQLAFTCKRLGVDRVAIANLTDVDQLIEKIQTEKFDILVLDSFQCLKSKKANGPKATEEYAVNRLVKAAQDNECVVGFIMHRTKAGKLKGSSLIPHAVDMNIHMNRGDEEIYGTDQIRVLETSKNRFGSTGEIELEMGPQGFIFDSKVTKVEGATGTFSTGAGGRKPSSEKEGWVSKLIELGTNGQVTLNSAVSITGNFYRGKNLLKELEAMNKLRKFGRGEYAFWRAI